MLAPPGDDEMNIKHWGHMDDEDVLILLYRRMLQLITTIILETLARFNWPRLQELQDVDWPPSMFHAFRECMNSNPDVHKKLKGLDTLVLEPYRYRATCQCRLTFAGIFESWPTKNEEYLPGVRRFTIAIPKAKFAGDWNDYHRLYFEQGRFNGRLTELNLDGITTVNFSEVLRREPNIRVLRLRSMSLHHPPPSMFAIEEGHVAEGSYDSWADIFDLCSKMELKKVELKGLRYYYCRWCSRRCSTCVDSISDTITLSTVPDRPNDIDALHSFRSIFSQNNPGSHIDGEAWVICCTQNTGFEVQAFRYGFGVRMVQPCNAAENSRRQNERYGLSAREYSCKDGGEWESPIPSPRSDIMESQNESAILDLSLEEGS